MYNKNVRYNKSGYKLEWNPITLILGIKCIDGFVIGSYNKSVEGEFNPIKRLDCEKISKLPNQNCLIEIAGNGDYAKRVLVELEKEMGKNIEEINIFNKKFTSIIKEIYSEDFVNEYMGFKKSFTSIENG